MGVIDNSATPSLDDVSPTTVEDDGVSWEIEEPVGPWLVLPVLLSPRGEPSNGPWDADPAGAVVKLEPGTPELLSVFEKFLLSGRDPMGAAVKPEGVTPVESFQLSGMDPVGAAVRSEGLINWEELRLPGTAVPKAQLSSLVPVALTERGPAEKTPVPDGMEEGNGLVPGAAPVPNPPYSLVILPQGLGRDNDDEADCADERGIGAAPVVSAGPVAWLP